MRKAHPQCRICSTSKVFHQKKMIQAAKINQLENTEGNL